MLSYVKYILLVPVGVICAQFYFHAVAQKGVEKQNECRTLGILYASIGIVSLVSRDVWYVVAGLVMIMLGLRLIAHGLDRIDKRVFIDRYEKE